MEVIAKSQAAVWLGDCHDGARPEAGGLLDDSALKHLCHFSFDSLVMGLQHTIVPLPGDGSRRHVDVVLHELEKMSWICYLKSWRSWHCARVSLGPFFAGSA